MISATTSISDLNAMFATPKTHHEGLSSLFGFIDRVVGEQGGDDADVKKDIEDLAQCIRLLARVKVGNIDEVNDKIVESMVHRTKSVSRVREMLAKVVEPNRAFRAWLLRNFRAHEFGDSSERNEMFKYMLRTGLAADGGDDVLRAVSEELFRAADAHDNVIDTLHDMTYLMRTGHPDVRARAKRVYDDMCTTDYESVAFDNPNKRDMLKSLAFTPKVTLHRSMVDAIVDHATKAGVMETLAVECDKIIVNHIQGYRNTRTAPSSVKKTDEYLRQCVADPTVHAPSGRTFGEIFQLLLFKHCRPMCCGKYQPNRTKMYAFGKHWREGDVNARTIELCIEIVDPDEIVLTKVD